MSSIRRAPIWHRAGTALAQSLLERLIIQDPVLLRDLAVLEGKCLGISCTLPGLELAILPTAGGIQLQPELPDTCDAVIEGPAPALLALARSPQNFAGIEELTISGDAQLADQLAAVLARSDLELEDLIASVLGDQAAQPIGQLLRSGLGWLERTTQSFEQDLQEYLQEESRQLPGSGEMRARTKEISTLRMATDRLEARLQQLLDQRATRA